MQNSESDPLSLPLASRHAVTVENKLLVATTVAAVVLAVVYRRTSTNRSRRRFFWNAFGEKMEGPVDSHGKAGLSGSASALQTQIMDPPEAFPEFQRSQAMRRQLEESDWVHVTHLSTTSHARGSSEVEPNDGDWGTSVLRSPSKQQAGLADVIFDDAHIRVGERSHDGLDNRATKQGHFQPKASASECQTVFVPAVVVSEVCSVSMGAEDGETEFTFLTLNSQASMSSSGPSTRASSTLFAPSGRSSPSKIFSSNKCSTPPPDALPSRTSSSSDIREDYAGHVHQLHSIDPSVVSRLDVASSSKSKSTLGLRFYDCLNGLREFEPQSNSTSAESSRSLRFNIFLDGLECEFETITESLRKERDELKVKVETQALELRNVRNVICQRCNDQTPQADPVELNSSATPNDEVEKELGVEMEHALAHSEAILCINFSQDGTYLAAGCQDGKAYVYDVQTGTLVHTLTDLLPDRDTIGAVCFSRDGKYLVTGSRCGTIYVWEIKTKYVRNAFKGYTDWVRSLDFSPNGRLVVSTSENSVRLWNMRDGAAKDLTDDKAIDPYYTSAVFSPDGEYVAASHRDGMVRVWHVCTVQLMKRVKAHMDIAFDVGFTPDGKGVVTGGGDQTLKYWDISFWNLTFIRARSQTNDSDRCVSALEEQTLAEREYSGQDHSGRCLAISPDGRWVASGSVDATIGIWDTRSREMQCILDHTDWISSVEFSPAGHYLASGEGDGTLKIWKYSQTTDVIQVYDGP